MRSLEEVIRALLVFALLTFTFLFGRPLYWGIRAHWEDSLDVHDHDVAADEDDARHVSTMPMPSQPTRPVPGVVARPTGNVQAGTVKGEVGGVAQPDQVATVKAEGGGGSAPAAAIPPLAKGVRAIVHEGRPLLDILKGPIWTPPPEGTKFPGKEEFALRKEMVQYRTAEDGLILVTFANFAFMDFVLNWVRHLTDEGVQNILVGAMDTRLLEALFRRGVPVFDMESGMQAEDAAWGSPVFHKMGREKVILVNVFLSMGAHLLICDTDAVFLKNPLPYVRRFPDADMLMSSDQMARTVEDDDLEDYQEATGAFNIGILLFRPTDPCKRLAREWAEMLANDDNIWDQNGFNDAVRKKMGPSVEGGSSKNLFYAYDGTLKAGILPVSIFCSGHTYFIQRLYSVLKMEPYAIHTTFQFAGADGKRHRLREAQHFRDPPEYYSQPPGQGLISFASRIPQALLTKGNHTLFTHFKLMNYQLRQLRGMMALAILLNRTMVFPEIWARFDSQYFPHKGIVETTDTAQPLIVPLDHLLQVNLLHPGALDEEQLGPSFGFREYSFLDNPATPPEIKASKLTVTLCRNPSSRAAKLAKKDPYAPSLMPCSVRLASPSQLLLPEGSTSAEIVAAFAPFQDRYKWFEFQDPVERLIGSWDDKELQRKYYKRLQHLATLWCCLNAHPGHIFYDFFADQKPGWKPRPPATPAEDHAPMEDASLD